MAKNETDTFYPRSRRAWRQWLVKNHKSKESVWLILYKKESFKPTITWAEAVDEALCFGWVDSKRKPLDEEKFTQFFSKRKPKGTWSKINKDKVEKLIAEGLMAAAGISSIELAKANGSWNILDEVEKLVVPKDLAIEFKSWPGSKVFFNGLSRSVKKMILQWIMFAKRPETRRKRIVETAKLASRSKRPKQFQ